MGRLQDRQTITIHSCLIGWRKLLARSERYYSGYCDKTGLYLSYIEFSEVIHYPELRNHWPEHYLGKDFNGNYYMLLVNQADYVKGPML